MLKKYTAIAMLAATCLFLSGCDKNQDENADKAVKVAEREIAPIFDGLYTSIKFTNTKAVDLRKMGDGYMVCGNIEAKNKKGEDYHNAFAAPVRNYDGEDVKEFEVILRYNPYDGKEDKVYYVYKTACTEDAEAYEKAKTKYMTEYALSHID